MTTIGQLDSGIAQIVGRGTGELIGYVFTEASGSGQLQRWLLYRHPRNAFDIHPPPPSMSDWGLSDWRASVPSLWRPGSFYVWAQSDVYHHGGTYEGETWAQIPSVSRLPAPTFPGGREPPFQLDPCLTAIECLQPNCRGLVYPLGGLTDDLNVEYWMLPAQYQPAGKSCPTSIAVGAEDARSLQEFIHLANRSWGPGCTFVITGCVNHQSKLPPASP